jgi:hypothetical protein
MSCNSVSFLERAIWSFRSTVERAHARARRVDRPFGLVLPNRIEGESENEDCYPHSTYRRAVRASRHLRSGSFDWARYRNQAFLRCNLAVSLVGTEKEEIALARSLNEDRPPALHRKA